MKRPEDFGITKYDKEKFEKTGVLDCFQNVDLSNRNLSEIPFNFGIAHGDFILSVNNLKSLKGSPKKVLGDFDCSHNQLKSSQYFPKEVNQICDCSYNQLTSLEGSPLKAIGGFYCQYNKLKKINNLPEVKGSMVFFGNPLDMTVQEWIEFLTKTQHSSRNFFKLCLIVSDNSTYESTLKGLKEKQAILALFD